MNGFRSLALCLGTLLFSATGFGAQLFIIDQNGAPVTDAVVTIPTPADYIADTQSVAIMDQVDKQFSPTVLTVNKGQPVKFPNSDDIRHHVYSFSEVKPFEIKLYKGSDIPPIVYENAGISVLGCNIHDNMIGYIYIADQEITRVSDSQGMVDFAGYTVTSVSIWHAQLSLGSTSKQQFDVTLQDNQATITVELKVVDVKPKKRTFGYRK